MKKYNILEVCDVYQPKTVATKQFVPNGQYLVYGANGIIGTYDQYNHEDSEVLMACRGATCGAINVSKPYSWINGNAMVIHPKGNVPIMPKYLSYCLQASDKTSIISGTAQPQITRNNMKEFQLSLCELEEQERIVSRIEELFSSLDNAVDTLKKTKEQLAVYRQAVLKEAFEGQFTNRIEPQFVNLGEFIEKPKYGTSKKCGYHTGSSYTPVFRIPNIDAKNGIISHDDLKFAEFEKNELLNLKLETGDLLIIRSNGSVSIVGTVAMIREIDTSCTFAGYLMRLRIKNKECLLPKYLLYYLSSFEARVYIERVAKSTSGVNNVNAQEISNIAIPYVVADEQALIVTEIEARLSMCDNIEKTVDSALAQAEAMRQSILKEAFEGRLA